MDGQIVETTIITIPEKYKIILAIILFVLLFAIVYLLFENNSKTGNNELLGKYSGKNVIFRTFRKKGTCDQCMYLSISNSENILDSIALKTKRDLTNTLKIQEKENEFVLSNASNVSNEKIGSDGKSSNILFRIEEMENGLFIISVVNDETILYLSENDKMDDSNNISEKKIHFKKNKKDGIIFEIKEIQGPIIEELYNYSHLSDSSSEFLSEQSQSDNLSIPSEISIDKIENTKNPHYAFGGYIDPKFDNNAHF